MIKLCSQDTCTGCGACYNICSRKAINMSQDAEGFLYPIINVTPCVECGLCEKICPILHPLGKYKPADVPIAAISKDQFIVKESSSGGVFSVLSKYILENEGLVYGATMDEIYNIYHTVVHNELELARLRGSKYVQSNTLETFREVKTYLKGHRKVLYCGTPCQIAGLRNYLGNIDTEHLYTIDLICHGVPSRKMFKTYIEKLAAYKGVTPSDFQNFQFRQFDHWGSYKSSYMKDGKRVLLSTEESIYMSLFLTNRLHRKSCYRCIYTTPARVGDITLADFWGIGSLAPFTTDTSKGCSMVLINSDKGQVLFSQIAEELIYEHRTWNEAINNNQQLTKTVVCPKDRSLAIQYLFEKSYRETYNKFFNTPKIRFNRFIGRILQQLHLLKLINK